MINVLNGYYSSVLWTVDRLHAAPLGGQPANTGNPIEEVVIRGALFELCMLTFNEYAVAYRETPLSLAVYFGGLSVIVLVSAGTYMVEGDHALAQIARRVSSLIHSHLPTLLCATNVILHLGTIMYSVSFFQALPSLLSLLASTLPLLTDLELIDRDLLGLVNTVLVPTILVAGIIMGLAGNINMLIFSAVSMITLIQKVVNDEFDFAGLTPLAPNRII